MMVPIRACPAGLKRGGEDLIQHALQLGAQGRVGAQQLLQLQLPGPFQGVLGAGVTVAAGLQQLLPQLVQLGADRSRPAAASARGAR